VITRLLLLALALLASAANASAAGSDAGKSIELRFGIFSEQKPGSYAIKEGTTQIPLYYGRTGFQFGYLIWEKNAKPFRLTTVTYPPSAPRMLGVSYKDQDPTKGLRSRSRELNGYGASEFSFDPGDPTGLWKMEIYVDGRLFKTIQFTVYEPNDKPLLARALTAIGAAPELRRESK
jgi:hypothetical protein